VICIVIQGSKLHYSFLASELAAVSVLIFNYLKVCSLQSMLIKCKSRLQCFCCLMARSLPYKQYRPPLTNICGVLLFPGGVTAQFFSPAVQVGAHSWLWSLCVQRGAREEPRSRSNASAHYKGSISHNSHALSFSQTSCTSWHGFVFLIASSPRKTKSPASSNDCCNCREQKWMHIQYW